MKNIVILISGGGSNMAAIVRASQQQDWAGRYGARVAAVVSNKASAGGLVFAKENGIAIATPMMGERLDLSAPHAGQPWWRACIQNAESKLDLHSAGV